MSFTNYWSFDNHFILSNIELSAYNKRALDVKWRQNNVIKPVEAAENSLQNSPVILAEDNMLEFLKYFSWKCINKCWLINKMFHYVINREKNRKNGQSILPQLLEEQFYMSKPSVDAISNIRLYGYACQEMHCFEHCKPLTIGSKPPTFTGMSEVYEADNSVQQIHLAITVVKDGDGDTNYTDHFQWMFENEITDESWLHIKHYFAHLLEPHGAIKFVYLVPFDIKILEDLHTQNSNLAKRIYAENLHITFELRELNWVTIFCIEYGTAKVLGWTLNSISQVEEDEDEVTPSKECLDTIGGFIGHQAHNFGEFDLDVDRFYSIDGIAVKIVQVFQKHEDPSKMINQISLKRRVSERYTEYRDVITVEFPFCLDEQDVFKRTYMNQNSDYVLQTSQTVNDNVRTIYFQVVKPTSQ